MRLFHILIFGFFVFISYLKAEDESPILNLPSYNEVNPKNNKYTRLLTLHTPTTQVTVPLTLDTPLAELLVLIKSPSAQYPRLNNAILQGYQLLLKHKAELNVTAAPKASNLALSYTAKSNKKDLVKSTPAEFAYDYYQELLISLVEQDYLVEAQYAYYLASKVFDPAKLIFNTKYSGRLQKIGILTAPASFNLIIAVVSDRLRTFDSTASNLHSALQTEDYLTALSNYLLLIDTYPIMSLSLVLSPSEREALLKTNRTVNKLKVYYELKDFKTLKELANTVYLASLKSTIISTADTQISLSNSDYTSYTLLKDKDTITAEQHLVKSFQIWPLNPKFTPSL